MKSDISILGLGYIGLPFALLLSKKGFYINAVDINKNKVRVLNKGKFKSEENEINKIYKSLKKKIYKFFYEIIKFQILYFVFTNTT